MCAACCSKRTEAGQTVGVNARAGSQVGLCPLLDSIEAEARHWAEFGAQGVAFFAQ